MTHSKIQPVHLSRNAIVYIRQSSVYQVHHHQESQKRQYALKHQAFKLGWSKEQVIIIDEDLGLSGAHSEGRPGYQKLVSMVALRQVGIIFGIEVSRLARNCLDWYQLLELASTFNTLIADEDGLFNPSDFNDRLLLGLKGTLSEAELYQIRARLMRGRLHKAQRGDLELRLPIGYERDPEGKTCKTPDQSVQAAINYVFFLFQQKRSVRGVLNALYKQKQELPYRKCVPGLGLSVDWHPASYDAIYHILYNPVYAGFYIYGKRKRCYHPESKKYVWEKIDPNTVEVVIPDHHEGYISPQTYQENIRMIQNNSYFRPHADGAPREGAACVNRWGTFRTSSGSFRTNARATKFIAKRSST
jgi:DNA invertase Pin-like site-specific DNA recombinase